MLKREDVARGVAGWDELNTRYARRLERELERLAGTHVTSRGSGPWVQVHARWNEDLPAAGLKIHVSLAPHEQDLIFERLLPWMRSRQLSFKLPNSLEAWYDINAGIFGEVQLGKIVTIYPRRTEDAYELAQECHELIPISAGPFLRTDVRLSPEGAVGLRFGLFHPEDRPRDESGTVDERITLENGETFSDERTLGQGLPMHLPEPPYPVYPWREPHVFEKLTGERQGYIIMRRLHQGLGKRLYLVMGVKDGRNYVAKIWFRGVGGSLPGVDHRVFADNERSMLSRIAGRHAPKLVDAYEHRDSTLLVMEIAGQHLYEAHDVPPLAVLASTADALGDLHEIGVVHMDVKPTNVMVQEAFRNRIALIDFETSQLTGEPIFHNFKTVGFDAVEDRWQARAEPSQDLVGLGATITDVTQGYSPSRLPGPLLRQIGLFAVTGRTICRSLVARCLRAPGSLSAREVARKLRELAVEDVLAGSPQRPAPSMQQRDLLALSYRLLKSADAFLVQSGSHEVFRSVHPVQSGLLEPLAQGNAGILLAQMLNVRSWGADPQAHVQRSALDWLATNPVQTHAKGLFTGDAGVSLVLALGAQMFNEQRYSEAAERRFRHSLNHDSDLDLYHGRTGILQAGLLLDAMGHPTAREDIAPLVEELLMTIQIEDHWIGWPAHRKQKSFGQNLGASHGALGNIFALSSYADVVGWSELKQLCRNWLILVFRHGRDARGHFLYKRPESVSDAQVWRQAGDWCHGNGSFLWTALAGSLVHATTRDEIRTSAEAFLASPVLTSPTYCHGLAGQLELCRLLAPHGLVPSEALNQRRDRLLAALRLHVVRKEGWTFLPSEEPHVVTPDFWVGFTGPALELSLQAQGQRYSIWSPQFWRNETKEEHA